MKHRQFLKNAATISFGGIAAKAIGALYRIPLANYLGGYGVGLYQMAYPLFLVLLTFSSAGVPAALSRMIAGEKAKGQENGETVKTAFRLFALSGAAGTLLMCLFAPYMSALQGEADLTRCYYALAPSVFLVALIAVLRGYFQGMGDMLPTAASEITEQCVKTGAGLFFCRRFAHAPVAAVQCALLSVTLSELFALIYLFIRYKSVKRNKTLSVRKPSGARLFSAAFPVMAAASLLPLSQTADSVVLVRLLGGGSHAVSLYGLFTGGALSLVSLPATACCGLAAASVPSVSACFARGEEERGRMRALYALAVSLLLSLPCAAVLYLFADWIVAVLYGGLSASDARVLVSLIRLLSVSAAAIAGVDTLAACLTGMGKAKCAAAGMLCAVLVKFVLQWTLVKNPSVSIFGAAIAANGCYLVAFFLDLFYTVKKKKVRKHDNDHRTRNQEGRRDALRAQRDEACGQSTGQNVVASFGAKPERRRTFI